VIRPDRFRTLEQDSFDAIVVGAGTGGLTTAALLARRGRSILVLDRHYVAGGNATVFHRPGYEFDVGLHYIGDCAPGGTIPRILHAAGVDDVCFRGLDPEGFDTLVFPDFTVRVPRGVERPASSPWERR
jgi:all-trans-retinol 13,14-reductase